MSSLVDLLRRRYPSPEWALLFEVRNATGYSSRVTRYADAIAMNLWPSRGLEVLGFEIKSYRGDWIRELKDPSKAEVISAYCDHWWIVAANKDVVKPEELPPTWGLLVAQAGEKGKLICVRDAPKLTCKELDRNFVASMLRRSYEQMESEIKRAIETNDEVVKAHEEGVKSGKADAAVELKILRSKVGDLEMAIRNFEEASGVKIDKWDGGRIGDAVRAVMRAGSVGPEVLQERLDRAILPLRSLVDAMEAMKRGFQLME